MCVCGCVRVVHYFAIIILENAISFAFSPQRIHNTSFASSFRNPLHRFQRFGTIHNTISRSTNTIPPCHSLLPHLPINDNSHTFLPSCPCGGLSGYVGGCTKTWNERSHDIVGDGITYTTGTTARREGIHVGITENWLSYCVWNVVFEGKCLEEQ